MLLELSEKVAQNERTIFTFITSKDRYSLSSRSKENENTDYIGADLIYDYFENQFKDDVTSLVHNEWLIADYALSNACQSGAVRRALSRKTDAQSLFSIGRERVNTKPVYNTSGNADYENSDPQKADGSTVITDIENEIIRVLRITELPLSASAIQIRSSDLNRIPLNSIVITLKRLCQARKLFEIVSSKGGQPLYRLTDVALSGSSNQKSHQQTAVSRNSDVKTAQPITKHWRNKYNEGTLEDILLTTLSSHLGYYSLSELYTFAPELSKFKRSIIVSSLLKLVNESMIVRDIKQNERNAMVTKYRIGG